MAGQDANALVAAIDNGRVLTAPLATTVPADEATDWDAAWLDLGFVAEDPGIEIVMAGDNTDVRAWTIQDAIRTIEQSRTVTLNFAMRQFDGATVSFAWDAEVGDVGEGHYSFTLPNRRNVQRMLAFEWDDQYHYRFVFYKGRVVENRNTTLPDTTTLTLPVGFRALRIDADTPLGICLTDDPSFAEAGA